MPAANREVTQVLDQAHVDRVLKRALTLPDDARGRFLDETCGRSTDMRAFVERLLADAESAEPRLQPGGGASGPLWQALAQEHADSRQLEAGDRLGAYRIGPPIGRGGMATVYRAERADGEFEQVVALKVLDVARHDEGLAVRFAQERQILATLDHPNIARLLDGGTTPTGQPYVVMEFVDGEPIDAYSDKHGLTVDQRIELFARVTEAVQYAHSRLIVHRDIKPSNILVTADGQPKLLDFGIAKLLDTDSPHVAPETRSAPHPMTPQYASPEQLRGEGITVASDVYQLGYLLYHLLTGQPPYDCDRRNVAEIVRVVCSVEPVPPSRVVGTTPGNGSRPDSPEWTRSRTRSTTTDRLRRRLRGDLDNILLRALAKAPGQRYPSALHLRDDLDRHLRGLPVEARRPTVAYRAARFAARHRAAVAASALLVLAILTGIGGMAWQANATAREARRAQAALDFVAGLFEGADPDVALGETISARALLDRGVARLDRELNDAPSIRAEIQGVIGSMYGDLGLYEQAQPLLEAARQAHADTGHRGAAAHAKNSDRLAEVLYEQGKYQEAERMARDALEAKRADTDTAPADLSASLGNLAAILSKQARAEEAHELYLQAIEIDRSTGDEEMLASHLSDYSAALYHSGRYDDAKRTGLEALSLHRKLYGPDHTLIATSLLNLGTANHAMGDYSAAERLLRECLEMRRRLLGEEHPHVALVYSNLGNLLRDAGRLDEAADAHRQALAIRRATLGARHPDVANTMNSLGVVMYFNGRYVEAAALFEQVLPLWRNAFGPSHPNVLSALNNLGAARREAGDLQGAEIALRETLQLRREAFGDTHRHVAQSLNNLGLLLARMGRFDEAESHFREAVTMWRQTMGDDHPDTGDGLAALGKFLLERGRCTEAEPLLRESLAIRERTLDTGAPLLASARLYLGECLVQLDRRDEAGELLAASLPVMVGHWGEDADITARARRALADTHR